MAKHSESEIKDLVKKMTLEEKCSLLSGKDFWHTKNIDRLNIPAIMVSDGPHGLRKQSEEENAGVNDSIKAVCFPAACATSCSFDRDIMKKLGETLGNECQAQKVSTLLGPAVNIKRSPLCGRNFEYISEDPFVAGELAAAYIDGVQSKKIGTSIKHFALNNQEYRRLTNSSECDERTMREIYLPAFETAVKKAQPATIMHSYNLINGTYAGESDWLLTDVLRKEWGFKGIVMSDWGAVNDRVAALKAGEDLEMPSSDGANDELVLKAVKAGKIDKKLLDETCERLLTWIFNYEDNKTKGSFDMESDRKTALEIARECICLLKNKGALPLSTSRSSGFSFSKKSALSIIGEFAEKPRIQGGGSSHINTMAIKSVLSVLESKDIGYEYTKGYSIDSLETDKAELEKAVLLAKKSKTVVVFAGLPDSIESEGYDRKNLELPPCQNQLIQELTKVNNNVVVVLFNGAPVTMPWVNDVNAIVEAYLGGESVAEACIDILTGEVNPSGKLAETFPLKLEDTPSYLDFAFDKKRTVYREGIFVGYRYYEKKKMPVLFPFGHGLSYTQFEYSSITLSSENITDDSELEITVVLKNTGSVDGKETVQLYVADKTNAAIRPEKELKGFEKVFIKAGSSAKITFKLNKRSFAWYNTDIEDWYAASGNYEILVGSSSQDIRLKANVNYKTDVILPLEITDNTTIGDLLRDERTQQIILKVLESTSNTIDVFNGDAAEAITPEMMAGMQDGNPLRNLKIWNHLSDNDYNTMIRELKAAVSEKKEKSCESKTKISKVSKTTKASKSTGEKKLTKTAKTSKSPEEKKVKKVKEVVKKASEKKTTKDSAKTRKTVKK